MKTTICQLAAASILIATISACNVSNPRITKKIVTSNLRHLGGATIAEFSQELDKLSDESELDLNSISEGEIELQDFRKLNFSSGQIRCSFTYKKALFKVSVDSNLALGQSLITELTPLSPENQTNGTLEVRAICDNELSAHLPINSTSTLVAATERKLAIQTFKESIQDLQNLCLNSQQLGAYGRCQGLDYSIEKANFYSAGGSYNAYTLHFDFNLGSENRVLKMLFNPSSAAILSGGILQMEQDGALLLISAGSLGKISQLELSNLK